MAETFEEYDEDYNLSGSTEKKKRKSCAGRRLMRWHPDVDQLVLLAIDHVCMKQGIPLPWDDVAHEVEDWLSGEAIKQHLTKIRTARESIGQKVPAKLDKHERRKARDAATKTSSTEATSAVLGVQNQAKYFNSSFPLPDGPKATKSCPSSLVHLRTKAKTSRSAKLGQEKSAPLDVMKTDEYENPSKLTSKKTGKKWSSKRMKDESISDEDNDLASPTKKARPTRLRALTIPSYKDFELEDDNAADGDYVDDTTPYNGGNETVVPKNEVVGGPYFPGQASDEFTHTFPDSVDDLFVPDDPSQRSFSGSSIHTSFTDYETPPLLSGCSSFNSLQQLSAVPTNHTEQDPLSTWMLPDGKATLKFSYKTSTEKSTERATKPNRGYGQDPSWDQAISFNTNIFGSETQNTNYICDENLLGVQHNLSDITYGNSLMQQSSAPAVSPLSQSHYLDFGKGHHQLTAPAHSLFNGATPDVCEFGNSSLQSESIGCDVSNARQPGFDQYPIGEGAGYFGRDSSAGYLALDSTGGWVVPKSSEYSLIPAHTESMEVEPSGSLGLSLNLDNENFSGFDAFTNHIGY